MGARTGIEIDKRGSRLKVKAGGNGRIALPVRQGSTASSNANSGLLHIGSTSGAKEFAIDAPEPGVALYVSCTAATTVNTATVAFSTDNSVTIDGSTAEQKIQFVRGGAGVSLIGRSTSKWSLLDSLTGSTEANVTT